MTLREFREGFRLTQTEVAEQMRITQQRYSALERAEVMTFDSAHAAITAIYALDSMRGTWTGNT